MRKISDNMFPQFTKFFTLSLARRDEEQTHHLLETESSPHKTFTRFSKQLQV